MFTIVLASPKGGVGKTTTSLLLALTARQRGVRVAVLDADSNQQSAYHAGRDLNLPVALTIDAMLGLMPEGPELLIVDTPPQFQSPEIKALCQHVTDPAQGRIVVPMSPSYLELHATLRGIAVMDLQLESNPAAALLLAKVNLNTVLGRQREAFAKEVGLPVLQKFARTRPSYANAMASGWDAIRRNADAAAEINAIYDEITASWSERQQIETTAANPSRP